MRKNSARLTTELLSAKVNVSRPQSGIRIDKIAETSLKGQRILAVSHVPRTPPTLVDHYVRGDDLIANYLTPGKSSAGHDALNSTDQIYWRHIHTGGEGLWQGLELVISLQTDSLGIAPRVKLTTRLPAQNVALVKDAWRHPVLEPIRNSVSIAGSQAAAVLFQSHDAGWSYLQSLYFMDDVSCEKTEFKFAPQHLDIKSTLFVEHLEKGVIRRVRARGVFCDTTEIEKLHLLDWFNEFAASEQPLTV